MPDLQDIPTLLARIQHAVDHRDAAGFAACWTVDAVLNLNFEDGAALRLDGRDAILGLAASGWKGDGSPLRHIVGSISVTASATDSTSARARSYALYLVPGQRPAAIGAGYYDDRLIFEEGKWRIAERHHRFLNPIQLATQTSEDGNTP